jgi:hypothetical protein
MTSSTICFRLLLSVLLCIALTACGTFNGAPPPPSDVQAQVTQLSPAHSAQAIIQCIALPIAQQTDCRDSIAQARLIAIDLQYTQFRQNFYGATRWGGFAATVASLGLTTTAGLSGIAAATGRTLSSVATAVTGTRAAFEKDILVEKTANAIETAMDASRNTVAARIRKGLQAPATDYPLAVALSDLESYYNAGTLLGALAGITEAVGEQSARANNELLTISGFNTTGSATCLQRLANMPGDAGRANRKLIADKARTAGGQFELLTDWMTDPNTSPAQMSSVARAMGCPA